MNSDMVKEILISLIVLESGQVSRLAILKGLSGEI